MFFPEGRPNIPVGDCLGQFKKEFPRALLQWSVLIVGTVKLVGQWLSTSVHLMTEARDQYEVCRKRDSCIWGTADISDLSVSSSSELFLPVGLDNCALSFQLCRINSANKLFLKKCLMETYEDTALN